MTSPQTYLILIKDGSLALAVGAALEDRLLRDGHCSLSLVPAVRGPDFADTVDDRNLATRFGPRAATRPPHVVALYEDGLLPRLESLGLAAYIGVPREEDWRIVRWDQGTGAMMLPVASARDLVDAVAEHTPWSLDPGGGPSRRGDARGAWSTSPILSRKVAAASFAGPLLLVGIPSIAGLASSGPAQLPAQAGAATQAPVAAVDTAYQTPAAQAGPSQQGGSVPAPAAAPAPVPAPAGTSSTTSGGAGSSISNFFRQVGDAFQQGLSAYGRAEITNAQATNNQSGTSTSQSGGNTGGSQGGFPGGGSGGGSG